MAAPDFEPSPGSLSVVRFAASGAGFETFIAIAADGSITAFNGHVDLGTGIRTALGQIVAEELDVSFARVVVVLGDTSRVPDQGATIASETIQITAVPLRKAAAQARQFLVTRAAERLELPVAELSIDDGLIRGHDNRGVSYGELIAGETIRLELAEDVSLKPVDAYSIVGQSMPRVDLPAKATGELVYVHDVRVPGMLHGRVVRPPYAGVDAGVFRRHQPDRGRRSFGPRYSGAGGRGHHRRFRRYCRRARGKCDQGGGRSLRSRWKPTPDAARPERHRDRAARQSVDATNTDRQRRRRRCTRCRCQADSNGPTSGPIRCTVRSARPARWWIIRDDRIRGVVRHAKSASCCVPIWRCCCRRAGQRNRSKPDGSRRLLRPQLRRRRDGGRRVLLSRAVGRPVRVQLTREQEHAWEPKGTAQLMDVKGGLECRRQRRRLRFCHALSFERRADPGAAADGNAVAPLPAVFGDGRPHRDPALRL